MQPLLVLCACPTREHAQTIARSLVEHHLAACVNLLPAVQSIYRWQGGIETAEETLLLIKTRAERLEELKVHVLMLHPYELPEIIAVTIDSGLDRYLQWIGDETRATDA
ncbi:divalent-cation tolerance protein CutA [Xanthomonadaceae bacterium JHOS43]|nr:divalent-cation tolerance protein CutA [Xanthomonadaceae bacterium JHOS43]